MGLYYQYEVNEFTRLAVWKLEEPESFFLENVTIESSITHPHKRLQHLAGRYLLPLLYPGFPIHLIKIADTRKPYLPNNLVHFSISHCGDFAAAIVSPTEQIGIDIELVTHRVDKIKYKFLHPTELSDWHIEALVEQERYAVLTLLWSAKEALFKWWGRGDIDFSDCMQIKATTLKEQGTLMAVFQKDDFKQTLQLNYILRNSLSLVWVNSI